MMQAELNFVFIMPIFKAKKKILPKRASKKIFNKNLKKNISNYRKEKIILW